jgi:hypothetical protein
MKIITDCKYSFEVFFVKQPESKILFKLFDWFVVR